MSRDTCSACLFEYYWENLNPVGIQDADPISGTPTLELRNCVCGNTIARAMEDRDGWATAAWNELDNALGVLSEHLVTQGPDLTQLQLEAFATCVAEIRAGALQLRYHPTTGPVTVGRKLARDMDGVVGAAPGNSTPPGASTVWGRNRHGCTVDFHGIKLDVTYDYERPERETGYGGNLAIVSAVDERGLDHWPVIDLHDVIREGLVELAQHDAEHQARRRGDLR